MEHEPQRDASPFGDTRRSRAEVAFVEEIKQRVDHGMARASGAGEASIEAASCGIRWSKLLHPQCNYKAEKRSNTQHPLCRSPFSVLTERKLGGTRQEGRGTGRKEILPPTNFRTETKSRTFSLRRVQGSPCRRKRETHRGYYIWVVSHFEFPRGAL